MTPGLSVPYMYAAAGWFGIAESFVCAASLFVVIAVAHINCYQQISDCTLTSSALSV